MVSQAVYNSYTHLRHFIRNGGGGEGGKEINEQNTGAAATIPALTTATSVLTTKTTGTTTSKPQQHFSFTEDAVSYTHLTLPTRPLV